MNCLLVKFTKIVFLVTTVILKCILYFKKFTVFSTHKKTPKSNDFGVFGILWAVRDCSRTPCTNFDSI